MARKARVSLDRTGKARAVPRTAVSLSDAKDRLDSLVNKARDQFYKPIAVAEILFRSRTEGLDLANQDAYRRPSERWSKAVARELWSTISSSNSKYWDHMFDDNQMSAVTLLQLGQANNKRNAKGPVEAYIYAHLSDKLQGIRGIIAWVTEQSPRKFQLIDLINKFVDDCRYKNSVDKLYEVVVYALFEAVIDRLDAKISLTINPKSLLLKSFDDFAFMVLGVNAANPCISQTARLYRVGKANASDGGLDMWANFGPAVQVKHISLTMGGCSDICEKIYADKIIIVCKDAAADVINTVLTQVGLGERIRGIIPESLLCEWYKKACNMPEDRDLGNKLMENLVREMGHEFSTSQDDAVDRMTNFAATRGYKYKGLAKGWDTLWALRGQQ